MERVSAEGATDCPFCHHQRATLLEAAQPMRDGGRWDIYGCDECGCYYPRPRSQQTESLEKIRRDHERDHEKDRERAGNHGDPRAPLAQENLAWRLKRFLKPVAFPYDVRHYLRKRLTPGGRALDLGAANGRFCFVLECLGYEAYGLEPKEDMAAFARDHGMRVYSGYFPGQLPGELTGWDYDLITCMESLYYLVDIRESLGMMRDMLKPEGHLMIKTVNGRSRCFEKPGPGFAKRYGDFAQAFPTLESLEYWMDRSGFEVLDITGSVWPGPPPEGNSLGHRLQAARSRLRNKVSAITLFGKPLFDLDKAEVLLVLARKRPRPENSASR